MNNIYVIADTHFGHKKALDFRPQYKTMHEHDSDLVARWNAVVKPKDTIWHLGDVFFGGLGAGSVLGYLNGIKRLVMGNHDAYGNAVYTEYFKVYGAVELKGCILTHIPVHTSQFPRYHKNIHGHLHSNCLDDSRYVCVSVEQTNYAPVLLNSLITEV